MPASHDDDNDNDKGDDDGDDARMGSVLLLCYGNRAAIAARSPISNVEKEYLIIIDLICLSMLKLFGFLGADC